MKHTKARKAAIILFWLLVWQAAAVAVDNRILLVGPVQVLRAFGQNIVQPDFIRTILTSLMRIGLGFCTAFATGLLLGALGYRFRIVEEVLEPVMLMLKSVPVAAFVVLLLIWFGAGRLSFCISFLIVLPNIYVNTMAGLKSADASLLEMARVFGVSGRNRFFYIYRPALMPYLYSGLKIALGMSWKSGVAAEVIGLPAHSLGERLYMAKIYLDTAGLFAWTLTIILISFLFEKTVLAILYAYGAWKPCPTDGGRRRQDVAAQEDRTAAGDRHKTAQGEQMVARNGHKAAQGEQMAAGDGRKAAQRERATAGAGRKKVSGQNRITLSGVCKSYGDRAVLQAYDMTMEQGGRYVLMAPSGAGKTTLLRILTGLDNADAGTILGMPERFGMLFQEDRLCEAYDAVCNIMLGCRLSAEAVRREAVRILPEECLGQPVRELSGGMRRRVALLRAVLSETEMLVLDEPFTGLDEENRIRTAAYLLDRLEGRTLLLTTHREEDVSLLRGDKVTLAFYTGL